MVSFYQYVRGDAAYIVRSIFVHHSFISYREQLAALYWTQTFTLTHQSVLPNNQFSPSLRSARTLFAIVIEG